MIVQHAHQADDIGAQGQRIGGEIPAHRHGAVGKPFAGKALPALLSHRRQVEQQQIQPGVCLANGGQEGAAAAAHIHQPPMLAKAVSRQDFLRHHGLAGRHQGRVIRNFLARQRPWLRGAGIGPILRQGRAAPFSAEQFHRVRQIGVEHGVVFYHGGDAGIADHGRAQFAQRPGAIRPPTH